MRRFFAQYKRLILAGLIALAVIPIFINLLFKIPAPCVLLSAEWNAEDVLSFYGTLLGAIATIVGVYWSIRYAQHNYREDERNRVRPYFALTHLKSKNALYVSLRESPQNSENNEKEPRQAQEYEEYKLDRLFIILGDHSIQYKYELTQTQKDILATSGMIWEEICNGGYARTSLDYISLPFEVENVGNGAALCFRVGFYADGDEKNGINIFTIKKNTSFYVHIFSSNLTEEQMSKDYWLEFVYRDICGVQYSQKYPVKFGRDTSTKRIYQQIDLTGKQTVVKEK